MVDKLSSWQLEKIARGEAILFLGSGASMGSKGPNGEQPVSTNQLRDLLCDEFFGGELKERPLTQVAEYAKQETSLLIVQRYVAKLLEPLQPAPFHSLISDFRWFAIITTNYDLLVERVYHGKKKPMQRLAPIIRNDDNFSDVLSDLSCLPYLKLHGCISTISDENLPLILASEEYAKHRHNRDRLFEHFKDWARERFVLFCGYELADPNIQQIMFDLGDNSIRRQRFAIIKRNINSFDRKYWGSRRVDPIQQTFEKFIRTLDTSIPEHQRQLSILLKPKETSLQRWIQSGTPSEQLLLYLKDGLTHVHDGIPTKGVRPISYYSGVDQGWSGVSSNLDVPRRITDEILIDAVLDFDEKSLPRVFLLKGYAGSGKSVTLRRLAWNAATDLNSLVLWIKEGSNVRCDLVAEVSKLTGEPIVLFVDDGLFHIKELEQLTMLIKRESLPITVVFSARTNEWNSIDSIIEGYVTKDYELRDLTHNEIDNLIQKLEEHDCLGELVNIPREDRYSYFELSAQRQLLVALHEATAGKSLEDIVISEYENIFPKEAQLLYLDVCTLHRFRVGMRAGLLSRISGITFTYFSDHLFSPLEHIIHVYFDASSRDYAYRTRHSYIADLVFRTILRDPEERANQLVRIVASMNVDYSSDNVAFEQLIRGRDLAEIFADRMFADRVFSAANRASANPAHIDHQRAVFELQHPSGEARTALRALQAAEEKLGHSSDALKHTRAMALRQLASESSSNLERSKLRRDAKDLLKRQMKKRQTSHALFTYCQILLDELRERLSEESVAPEDLDGRVIADISSRLDKLLYSGRQQYPDSSRFLDLEANFARLLNDAPRVARALQRAHQVNPENGYVAVRLARYYKESDDIGNAKKVLLRCFESNAASKPARLEFALILIEEDELHNLDNILAHLKASFSEGDTNYEAQFWCARHEYLHGSRRNSKRLFGALDRADLSPSTKRISRSTLQSENGLPKRFVGTIVSKTDNFCFVECAEIRDSLFCHFSTFSRDDWNSTNVRDRVSFSLAFSYRGAHGICVSKRN